MNAEIRVAELISHRLPLVEAPRVFELAAQARTRVLNVVLDRRAAS